MNATLHERVQELRGRYPDALSAVLPALQLAQASNDGWLSEDAFRAVADALGLTPAYCLSVASFYDMFRLTPTGRHVVEVCTNVSCAVKGAQQVVDAFERELAIETGATTADGAVTLRAVECLGGCGWATVVAIDNRHRLNVLSADVPAIVRELRGDA